MASKSSFPAFGRLDLLVPLALLLLPWLVFLPSLHGTFVFDDISGITQNEAVQSLDHIGEMARFWVPGEVSYRPLRYLTYALDWVRGDGDPVPFHQTNLLLHGLGGIALWGLLVMVLDDRRLAAWAALLWLVHPLQTEAVCYVSGRKDLLATLFYFIALIGTVKRARADGSTGRLAGSVLFLAAAGLSFLSKETALTLPVAALIMDAATGRRGGAKTRLTAALREGRVFYGLVAALGLAALFYKLVLMPGTKVPFNLLTDPLINLPRALRSYALYLRKMFWPWPLVADLRGLFPVNMGHLHRWDQFWNGGSWPAAILGAGLAAGLLAAVRGTRRAHLVTAALLLYLVTALPVANLIPLNEPAAEHYAHLPLAALAVAFCAAAAALAERWRLPPRAGFLSAAAVLAVLAVASYRRAHIWRNPDTLWNSVIAVNDGSDRAWSNLGLVRLEGGNRQGARAAFRQALALGHEPQPRIMANLIQTLRQDGDLQEAIDIGRRGLAVHPDSGLLLSLTGGALLEAGQASAARPLLDRVVRTPAGPREAAPGWLRDRGLAHVLTGDPVQGEKLLREAVAADPADASALASLGWLLLGQEKLAEADTVLARAVALPDASGVAWRNRAVVLLRTGHAAEAARALEEAEARGDQVPPSLWRAVREGSP